MTSSGVDDPFLPIAFSLHSSPGAYAVLAGAGVSIGAGLPTAWGIVTAVANDIRQHRGEAPDLTPGTVDAWWEETYGTPLTYSNILEEAAPLPYEREALLKRFFEPAGDDPQGPAPAHTAVAELMRAGVVRVVVTLNFDHLFEDALRALSIDPVVISTDAQAGGMPPLHTIDHCVIHLHGDYRDAISMRNTTSELTGYSPEMRALMEQVVRNHGLLVAGWSAEHDHALREIIRDNSRRFYTPAWITPHPPTGHAVDVVTALGAVHLPATADEAFSRLVDSVKAMSTRAARHPLTEAVVVDRIKRDLTHDRPAITAHDSVNTELARLDGLPALDLSDTSTPYRDRVEQIAEACRVPTSAIATLTYWGSDKTDLWGLSAVQRWSGRRPQLERSLVTTSLPLRPAVAVRLFYAIGVAATAARRFDVVAKLFALPAYTSYTPNTAQPAVLAVDWYDNHGDDAADIAYRTRSEMAAAMSSALALTPDQIDTAWQEFESLRIVGQLLSSPTLTVDLLDEYAANKSQHETGGQLFGGPTPEQSHEFWENYDRSRGKVMDLARFGNPHLFVENRADRADHVQHAWGSDITDRITNDVEAVAPLGDLAQDIPADRRGDAITAAADAARAFLQRLTAKEVARSQKWLDAYAAEPR